MVESVAWSVCASLALDSSGSAVPYVTGWAERAEGDPIEDYACLIDRLARRIEAVVCGQPACAALRLAVRGGLGLTADRSVGATGGSGLPVCALGSR